MSRTRRYPSDNGRAVAQGCRHVGLQISKNSKIDFENVVARAAVRHSNIFSSPRNPFTPV
jgi:hypothetical protein